MGENVAMRLRLQPRTDDWFLYRDPDELVVQCWNEKVDAENFMKKLNYDLCEITEDIPESAIRRYNEKRNAIKKD